MSRRVFGHAMTRADIWIPLSIIKSIDAASVFAVAGSRLIEAVLPGGEAYPILPHDLPVSGQTYSFFAPHVTTKVHKFFLPKAPRLTMSIPHPGAYVG